MRKHITTALLAIALIGFVWLGVANISSSNNKLKVRDIQLQSKQSDLLQLENKFNLLNKELEQKNLDASKVKELEDQKIQLQEQLDKAQSDLQAKAKRQADEKQRLAVAAQKASGTAVASASGGCADWMAQAGISHPDAIWLISKESGCRSNAVNPSSYACGIAQELLEPNQRARQIASVKAGVCPKSGCSMSDPVCQMKWMQNYTYGRYGSWSAARAFHIRNNWY